MSTKCVNKMCQHTSSLLNSHNATMQRCIDNAHRKSQLSSTLDIPQLRQLKPFLEQIAMACILWMEKWEVYWTDCFFMPQDLVEIQVEQPQKEDNYQEYTELENFDGFRFEADIYMSKLGMHSVTLKVRDIQVWQPSGAPALVSLAGKNTPKL